MKADGIAGRDLLGCAVAAAVAATIRSDMVRCLPVKFDVNVYKYYKKSNLVYSKVQWGLV